MSCPPVLLISRSGFSVNDVTKLYNYLQYPSTKEEKLCFLSSIVCRVSFFHPTIAREIINHYICGKPRLDTWGSKLYSSRGDKPKGCKQHSSGKLKFPSSQATLISRCPSMNRGTVNWMFALNNQLTLYHSPKIFFTCQYTIYFKKYNYLYHEFIKCYGDIDKT